MKKTIVCGIASLAMAAMPVFGAFAEAPQAGTEDGYFMGSKDVSVGEVDKTIYSVDIDWGDMAFDWEYDAASNSFGFVNKKSCTQIGIGATAGEATEPQTVSNLYKDDACTESATLDYGGPFYSKVISGGNIDVVDNSVNGRIKAQASFTPESDYSWVIGKFSSVVYLTQQNTFSQDLDDGYLVGTMGSLGGPSYYNGILYLETNPNMGNTEPVTAGDKIGTITINIEPDLN